MATAHIEINIVQNSQSTIYNTSNVTANVYAVLDSGYVWSGYATYPKITLDGTTETKTLASYDLSSSSPRVFLGSITKNVEHKPDGTKTVSASASWDPDNSYLSAISGSATKVLTKIPRYATSNQSLNSKTETSITMNWSSDSTIDYLWYSKDNGSNWTGVNVTDGKSGSYTISGLSANTAYNIKTRVRRKDSQLTTDSSALAVTTYNYPHCTTAPSFTIGNKLTLSFYNPLGRTFKLELIGADGVVQSVSNYSTTTVEGFYNTAWINYWYSTIPSAKSGIYKVKVTYGSSVITKTGGTYSINSSNCTPTVGSFSYIDSNPTTVAITESNQRIIRNNSNLLFTVGSATPRNSASISKYEVVFNGVTKSRTTIGNLDFGVINVANNLNATLKVTDSRGLTASKNISVIIDNWELPTALISLKRKNNFYSESYLKVDGSCSYINGKNTFTIQYQYKKISDNSYSALASLSDNVQVTLNLDNNYEWNLKIIIKDKLGTRTYNTILERGMPLIYFDRLKSSVGINCFPSGSNDLYVGGVAVARSSFAQMHTSEKDIDFSEGSYITVTNWGTNDNISMGDFVCEPSLNRIKIPAGSAEYIRIFCNIAGYNNISASLLLQNPKKIVTSSIFNHQPSGNKYFQMSSVDRIVKLEDTTVDHWLYLQITGYNGTSFSLNKGYNANATFIGVERLK